MRLELPDGQWAELRDRLSYEQGRAVRHAFFVIDDDKGSRADLDVALVRAYLVNWNVLDTEGHAVPVETPTKAPDDVIQALFAACLDIWNDRADPKAGAVRSPTTLKALG